MIAGIQSTLLQLQEAAEFMNHSEIPPFPSTLRMISTNNEKRHLTLRFRCKEKCRAAEM